MTVSDLGLDAARLLADSIAGKFPDAHGRFGPFGGRYVPETLIPALERLEQGVREHLHSKDFQEAFHHELKTWVGRPTPLTFAARLSELWGANIWLKREDLAHTARTRSTTRSGKPCSRSGSAPNASSRRPVPANTAWRVPPPAPGWVCPARSTWARSTWSARRQTSGACVCWARSVVPVNERRSYAAGRDQRGSARLGIRPTETYYLIGSAVGPHPYPYLVRELQAVIGREARAQIPRSKRGSSGCGHRMCRGGGLELHRRFPRVRSPMRAWRSSESEGRRSRGHAWVTTPPL